VVAGRTEDDDRWCDLLLTAWTSDNDINIVEEAGDSGNRSYNRDSNDLEITVGKETTVALKEIRFGISAP